MWKGIRYCNLGAIILVAAAIVAGGITDIVPATTRESIADIFQDVVLLISACAGWAKGAAFGIALAQFGNTVKFAAVDDNTNDLEISVAQITKP